MRKYLSERFKSFTYAWKGIKTSFIEEPNMRIHTLAGICAVIAGFVLQITVTEWLFVIVAIGVVWVTELINTALENLVDLVQPDYHPLAGRVKDLAAGAVMSASIMAVAIGIIIFGRHIAVIVLHLK